jgi:hypothetical protein
MKPEEFGLNVSIETITPELADMYLLNNAYHRKVKQKKVDEFISELVEGQWKLNGKTICFDTDGRLLNGQHRMYAVSQSGVSLTTLVVRGLDPALIETKEENNAVIH